MSLRSIFWVAFLYSLVWAVILSVRDPGAAAALAFPGAFGETEIVVETSSCSKTGDEILWSCEAEGQTAEGHSAKFEWSSVEGHYLPAGEVRPVLAMALPIGSLPTIAIPVVEDPRGWAIDRFGSILRFPLRGLFAALAAIALELLSRLRRERGPRRIEIEHYSTSLGCTTLFVGLGVSVFFLGGAGVGWGSASIAIALIAQIRRFVVVDLPSMTLFRGWQVFLFRRIGAPLQLGGISDVLVIRVDSKQPAERNSKAILRTHSAGEQEIVNHTSAEIVEREARRAATLLGVPFSLETRTAESKTRAESTAEAEAEVEDQDEADEVSETSLPPVQPARIEHRPMQDSTVHEIGGAKQRLLLGLGCLCVLAAIALLVYLLQRGIS